MSIRTRIFGSGADEPLLRAKRPKGALPDVLHSVAVARLEGRRGNARVRDRHRLSEEQALLRHDGEEHVVDLVNVSAGGAMVRSDLALTLWDQVGLVLGEDGELDCAVRWIRDDRAGLEFAHETRIDCTRDERDSLLRAVIRKSFPEAEIDLADRSPSEEEPAAAEPQEARAAERHPLIWNGVVYHDFDEVEPVRLRNISTTGALIQSANALLVNSIVYLEIGELERIEAIVRWTRGGQSGLAFAKPFDIHLLSDARPELTPKAAPVSAFGHEAPWAPGWRRATVDQLARSLA